MTWIDDGGSDPHPDLDAGSATKRNHIYHHGKFRSLVNMKCGFQIQNLLRMEPHVFSNIFFFSSWCAISRCHLPMGHSLHPFTVDIVPALPERTCCVHALILHFWVHVEEKLTMITKYIRQWNKTDWQ